MDNLNKQNGLKNSVLSVFLIVFFLLLLKTTIATTSGSSGNANLTIWDDTDNQGIVKFSYSNITFNANFTNSTGNAINLSEGNCTIRFDYTGSYGGSENMTFNLTTFIWAYTTKINYKGVHNFQVNCTSTYGNITLVDNFTISNSPPTISKSGDFVDFDGNPETRDYLYCSEDILCIYNFSANVTEYDVNDVLIFGNGTNTTLINYFLNTTTGILTINYTNDSDIGNGNKQIELFVKDTESLPQNALLRVNISAENDPPYFLNLGGRRIINKTGINLTLSAADEENDVPYIFNVSFLSCVHTSLNPPTGPDKCVLFNLTYHNSTATNISFIPAENQKGEYEINFTVKDFRNASYSEVVNWTITWNDLPYFTYICDNERNTTEDSPFSCYVNASDKDELNNLTFVANYTWFTFNGTFSNITVISTGSTGNASALVNFTPTDLQVGNWSINLTVIDTGAPNASVESNSTIFFFFIENKNDSVAISEIPDITAYTSQNYSIFVNATDDDLLVPDKRVINETLTFMANSTFINISNQFYFPNTNRSQVTLSFNPNNFGVGSHSINITVCDKGNYSCASDIFTINVIDNSAPQWSPNMATNFELTEGVEFYLNLSQNVTDNEDINFTLLVLSSFNFDLTINHDTGIINFTPTDDDVGFHRVVINATDGKTPSPKYFNFTVLNVNDPPVFFAFYVANGTCSPNPLSCPGSRINVTEDTPVRFTLIIADDDLYIQQTSFYSENFNLILNLTGRNSSLFNFSSTGSFPVPYYQYEAYFTPRKSDVGNYNVILNITDASNASVFLTFNLTVNETLHPPNITTPIGNKVFSILNENFYFDVNATDLEDGSDGENTNLTFRIENLTAHGNFLKINSSTGVINFTTNSSLAGVWQFRAVVNDTHGEEDFEYFNLTIYDYPVILLPNSSYQFFMTENFSSTLNFTVNHTVQDSLNYTLIINQVVKNSTIGLGNGSAFLWKFTPNFTMETTCTGPVNLTLNVSNAKLSNSTSWLVEINYTNSPLNFITAIPQQSGGSPLTITLSDYFSDIDASDSCTNQTIGFSYAIVNQSSIGGSISVVITNWSIAVSPTVVFSAETDGSANFTITAYEYNGSQILSNLTSNEFLVSLTVQQAQATPLVGGGRRGSVKTQVVSLKILVPEPVSAKQKDKLIIPLGLENNGEVDLNKIYLGAIISKDGAIRKDLVASFDQSYFESLKVGEKKNITMIVDIDTNAAGLFEVTINATVETPVYKDWAKFYIQIEEDKSVLEKIIFTEEFIIGNPQCAELLDLVNDAKKLFNEGKIQAASSKTEEALRACNLAITQPPRPRIYERLGDKFIGYTAIASLIAFVFGFAYYTYKKISLNNQLNKSLGKI
mgnify:CR=1 FL=1